MFGFLLGNKYLAIAKWVAIAAAVWYIFHTWDKAQGYDYIKKQLDTSIADHNAYIKTRAAQDLITTQVSTDYENAVTDLVGQLNAARSAIPVISVHHCASKDTTPAATTGPNAASQNGPDRTHDEVVEVSTDEPLRIASEAATCGKRLNSLQDWIRQQNSLTEPR